MHSETPLESRCPSPLQRIPDTLHSPHFLHGVYVNGTRKHYTRFEIPLSAVAARGPVASTGREAP